MPRPDLSFPVLIFSPTPLVLAIQGPVYAGVIQDWKDRCSAVSSGIVPQTLKHLPQGVQEIAGRDGAVALLGDEGLAVRSAASSYALKGGTLADSLLAGWTELGPIVQARKDGRLSQATRKGCVPLGIAAQIGEVRIVQGVGTSRFLCRDADDGWSWRPSLVRGHAWPMRPGSFESAEPIGGGVLVIEDLSRRLNGGDKATLFQPGRPPRTVLRSANGIALGEEPTNEGLWVSLHVYRTAHDHVANVSRVGLLSNGGRLSSRFALPFEFSPGGLDDSGAWLLGIRTRALHGPNQDLVAVRLADHAVRTLYEGCARYVGLHPRPSSPAQERASKPFAKPGSGSVCNEPRKIRRHVSS